MQIITKVFGILILCGWQIINVHAAEVISHSNHFRQDIYESQDEQSVEIQPSSQDYTEFDGSYEQISLETLVSIPQGMVKEAFFNQDFELSESSLSATELRAFVARQPNLTKLHLEGNFLDDKGIRPLSQLRLSDLNIAKNYIGNNGLKNTIALMTSLRSLDISGNRSFDIDGLRSLGKVISGLHNFECDFTNLDDSGIQFIVENASQIETLRLRGVNLSDKGLDMLLFLDTLTLIDISQNPIPRHRLASFIEKMSKKGVRVVALFMPD